MSLPSLALPSVIRIPPPSPHTRYTRFWTTKSPLYRRAAYVLQIVRYVELLLEMSAKRRGGERLQWRVVVLLEFVKALCRLVLLRVTRARPVLGPPLPEREQAVTAETDPEEEERAKKRDLAELMGEEVPPEPEESMNGHALNGSLHVKGDWRMPRTGMSLPSLPASRDISGYLLSRVLTADDIRPASKLLHRLRGPAAQAAEVLHILAPLVYAIALARAAAMSRDGRGGKGVRSWHPWLLGVGLELLARQLRGEAIGSLQTTALEKEEWSRRGWSMSWWLMRGAAYQTVTKGMIQGVKKRMPSLVKGILEDYEYLWENYYFSTSS
jgi:peroxin-16